MQIKNCITIFTRKRRCNNLKKKNTIALLIALLSVVSAVVLNEMNLIATQNAGIVLRNGQTIQTADDISYIAPAVNLKNTGELKNSMPGNGAYFLRPPGYPLFLSVFYCLFENASPLFWMKIIQVLLFGASVYCLFFIALILLNSQPLAIAVSAFYGVSGIGAGFLYYTLSEGLTPALVLFYTFCLLKGRAGEKHFVWYICASLLFSLLFVVRPVLGILFLPFPFFLYYSYSTHRIFFAKRLLIAGIIAFSPMAVWQVRNWNIAGEYVGLHPIYYSENSMSNFRPAHHAMWNFCKGWGERGCDFHSYAVPFWENAISGNASKANVDSIIARMPRFVTDYFGYSRLEHAFSAYQKAIVYQKTFYDKQVAMPKEIPAIEQKAVAELNALAQEFKSEFWFQYHIASPLKVFKELAFHSNLSLFMFQHTYRGNVFVEVLRYICFAIHSLAFILVFVGLFVKQSLSYKMLSSVSLFLYVAYLIYFQRGIEERYALPVLSLVLVNAVFVGKRLFHFMKTNIT